MRHDEDSGEQMREGMRCNELTQGISNGNGMRLEELQRKAAMR